MTTHHYAIGPSARNVKPVRRPSSRANLAASADAAEIARLYAALGSISEYDNPRTARLLAAGLDKMSKKLIEEAGEVVLEAVHDRGHGVIRESADLIYHLVVLWHECGVAPNEVWGEMRRRADLLGIAEKLPKPSKHPAPRPRPNH